MLARLDEIRMRKAALAAEQPDKVWHSVDIRASYRDAFESAGYSFPRGAPDDAVSECVRRLTASAIKDELVAALDDWAWTVRDGSAETIWTVTSKVTGEEWRTCLPFASVSATEALRLTREVPIERITPALVCGLGFSMRLFLSGDGRAGLGWMETGARRYPTDFWVLYYLGIECMRLAEYESAAGAFRAAVAVRPEAELARKCLDRCLEKARGARPTRPREKAAVVRDKPS